MEEKVGCLLGTDRTPCVCASVCACYTLCGQVEHCALSNDEVACPLDQQQLGTEQSSSAVDDGEEKLSKQQLDEYQKLYEACIADYEHARNKVATLDNAIAKLRREIASVESTKSTAASAVSSSG